MRILTLGLTFPPDGVGGYEVAWASAVDAMRSAGHEVQVLSSRDLLFYSQGPEGAREHRVGELRRIERHNLGVLGGALTSFRPDVVNPWPLGGMSTSLIGAAARSGLPVVGVVSDDWLVYCFGADGWARRFRRRGVARVTERLTRIPTRFDLGTAATWIFNSEWVRGKAAEAHRLPRSTVARPGIDAARFALAPRKEGFAWRLLYLGRVERRKGVDIAVSALASLPEATLTIVGPGEEDYAGELRRLARDLGVGERVTFATVEREGIPGIYAAADALVFPVRWDEPWGLVPLESMGVGTPVVATGTGGSAEYLRDGENCLLFQRDDPEGLVSALRALGADGALRGRIRDGGLATAVRYDAATYNQAIIDQLELELARQSTGAR